MRIPPFEVLFAELFVLFLGIGMHEFAHCWFADLAGDPTPRIYGRVTLDLTKHFEPLGTILIVITSLAGFGFGWGKPAPMMPNKMKNPRWDFFAAVAAGPITNLLQAIVYALLFRFVQANFPAVGQDSVGLTFFLILNFGVAINLGLFLFNLIPFGPLDGHWLIGLLMPESARDKWFLFCNRVGMPGLFVLIIFLNISHISLLAGPVSYGFRILTGQPWEL